jgi:hypothetical protein
MKIMATHSSPIARPETLHVNDTEPSKKVEALAEIICAAGNEAAAALFVLMGTLGSTPHPEALANTAKHLAFTRCGELNVFGIVDAQIAIVETELFGGNVVA